MAQLRYGSVCSGIEAATCAWHDLGWTPRWFAEIDAFPSAVLAHHYPHVPNLGDFTQIGAESGPIDLLVGGTPCQSFSVAGERRGLDDPRGNLALEFCRLAERLRPRWIVWENVPGVLSSGKGRDFGAFLGALAERGYHLAYRVMDAQFFGVPQRRRRVFVVGYLGDWRHPAAVLFEPESLRGDSAPRREAREETAGAAGEGTSEWGRISGTLAASGAGMDRASGMENELDFLVPGVCPTLRAGGNRTGGDRPPGTDVDTCESLIPIQLYHQQAVCFVQNSRSEVRYVGGDGRVTGAITSEPGVQQQHYIHSGLAVRRLTPREAERLQGFPDDWTLVPYRGKPAADGPRYKAIGNSFAVPVVHWIGSRINLFEETMR